MYWKIFRYRTKNNRFKMNLLSTSVKKTGSCWKKPTQNDEKWPENQNIETSSIPARLSLSLAQKFTKKTSDLKRKIVDETLESPWYADIESRPALGSTLKTYYKKRRIKFRLVKNKNTTIKFCSLRNLSKKSVFLSLEPNRKKQSTKVFF